MLTLPLEAIDKQEALRYMGCPAEPDEALRTVVDTCEQQLRRTVQPRVVYRVLPLWREAGTLSAGGMQLTGEDIARHLAECDRMLLMAATLSGQADQLIHRAGISDMTRSLAMDALASAGIEQVCNRAEECFREQRTLILHGGSVPDTAICRFLSSRRSSGCWTRKSGWG